jgi:hypothetical protein
MRRARKVCTTEGPQYDQVDRIPRRTAVQLYGPVLERHTECPTSVMGGRDSSLTCKTRFMSGLQPLRAQIVPSLHRRIVYIVYSAFQIWEGTGIVPAAVSGGSRVCRSCVGGNALVGVTCDR